MSRNERTIAMVEEQLARLRAEYSPADQMTVAFAMSELSTAASNVRDGLAKIVGMPRDRAGELVLKALRETVTIVEFQLAEDAKERAS